MTTGGEGGMEAGPERVLRCTPSQPSGEPGANGGIAARLWEDSKDLAYQSLMNPFVMALGQGTLSRESFQHFIGQDAAFLLKFAETYSAALDHCSASQGHLATEVKKMLRGVRDELRLHESYAEKWGLLLEHQRATPATKAYIYFLEMVSRQNETSLPDIMSAVLPCLRLYYWLGCQLGRLQTARDNPYAEWIETYRSEPYAYLPPMAEAILDESYEPGTYDRLLSQYRTGMQLEKEFFASQPLTIQPRPIGLLVVDFDETVTLADTTGCIANAVIDVAVSKVEDPVEQVEYDQDLRGTLGALQSNYVKQRNILLKDILPESEASTTPTEFDMGWLGDFVKRLADFDVEMNKVVIQSGILRGIRREQLAQAGGKVEIHPGCLALMQKAVKAGIRVAVMSVSWSSEFVRAALAQEGLPVVVAGWEGSGIEPPALGAVTVYANELEFFGEESSGNLSRRCESGADKARLFDDLILGLASEPGGADADTLYVGDSMTDITPLISANVGILVGSNSLVRRLVRAAGLQLAPLASVPIEADEELQSGDQGAEEEEEAPAEEDASVGAAASASTAQEAKAPTQEDAGKSPAAFEEQGALSGPPMLSRLSTIRPRVSVEEETLEAASSSAPRNGSEEAHSLSPGGANTTNSNNPTLYEASSWMEIDAFLFGGRYVVPPRPTTTLEESTGQASGASLHSETSTAQLTANARSASSLPSMSGPFTTPKILVVAGTDSGGGAGITADVKTAMALGAHASIAVTAVTAQNSKGVQAIHALPAEFVERQMKSVLEDLGASVVKTGMLPTGDAVRAVVSALRDAAGTPQLVVDPVLVATVGDALTQPGTLEVLRSELIPMATIITPNLPEAAALLGDGRAICDLDDMRAAARELHALGPAWVLLKGGHSSVIEAPAQDLDVSYEDSGSKSVTDILFDGRTMLELSEPWIPGRNVHGTGCTLASAIAAELARGRPVLAAVKRAKRYVWRTLERSRGLPLGEGAQRAMNHGWATHDWAQELGGALRTPNAAELKLYAVTDVECNHRHRRSLLDAVRLAIDGGATIIQIRDKHSDASAFIAQAKDVVAHCRSRGVQVIINDRLDVAMALEADGAHIGQEDVPASVARKLLGPEKILGVSVRTPEQASAARAAGADYLGAGGFRATSTKADNQVIGAEGIADVVAATDLPVVAIGGIDETNASAALRTGAKGVAIVSAIFDAEDIVRATKRLRAVVDAALTARHDEPPAAAQGQVQQTDG